MTKRLWGSLALAAGVILAGLWHTHAITDIYQRSSFADFSVYFAAAKAVGAGKPIYDLDGMRAHTFAPYYKYPPLFASLLRYFLPFGQRPVAMAWLILSQGFYFASFLLLTRLFQLSWQKADFWIVLCFFLFFQPTIDSLNGPQMDCFLLLLLSLGCLFISSSKESRAGFVVACAAGVKVFPIAWLLYFSAARMKRAVLWFVLTLAFFVLLSIAISGWGPFLDFTLHVLPINAASSAYVENQSFFGFVSRFFTDGTAWNEGAATVMPALSWLSRGFALAVLSISLRGVWNHRHDDLFYAGFLGALLLSLPVVWMHYETLQLLPLTVIYAHFRKRGATSMRWALLGIGYLLLAIGNQKLAGEMPPILQSMKFYGASLLWGLCVWEERGSEPPPTGVLGQPPS
ncbi:MAG TPA: glycosyltransferase family 87 protein [Acidobacteriota bacterium]|nr:glycosyltransferase family 87 protein [Acidobacteriota bacterium]